MEACETSQAAFESIQSVVASIREQVYETLAAAVDGLTDLELHAQLQMVQSTERTRRSELVKAGRVKNSGRTRLTPSGRAAVVWEAVAG